MVVYISKDTFISGKPVFVGQTVEANETQLRELQACNKVSKTDPTKPIEKSELAKASEAAANDLTAAKKELAAKDAELAALRTQLADSKSKK